MLRKDIFQNVTEIWGEPTIDLFASRLNAQVACYASWRPDPGATYVDAFSISWENQFFYAFPLFSLIARCLQKIVMEKAEGTMIVPLWPTQPWYSQLLHLIVDVHTSTTTDHAQNARERTRTTPANQEDGSDSMQIIRESVVAQRIS